MSKKLRIQLSICLLLLSVLFVGQTLKFSIISIDGVKNIISKDMNLSTISTVFQGDFFKGIIKESKVSASKNEVRDYQIDNKVITIENYSSEIKAIESGLVCHVGKNELGKYVIIQKDNEETIMVYGLDKTYCYIYQYINIGDVIGKTKENKIYYIETDDLEAIASSLLIVNYEEN